MIDVVCRHDPIVVRIGVWVRMGVRTSWNVVARLRREPELGRPRGRDPLTAKAQRRAGGYVTRPHNMSPPLM